MTRETDASHASTKGLARAVAVRLEDWISERQDALAVLADVVGHAVDQIGGGDHR